MRSLRRGMLICGILVTFAIGSIGHAPANGSTAAVLADQACRAEWQAVDSPRPDTWDHAYLEDVAALGPQDAWAVGSYYAPPGDRTLIQHWDGARWAIIPSPNANAATNELRGIAAAAADDIWAVGASVAGNGPEGSFPQTLILHWDGTEWRRVQGSNPGRYNELYDVAALAHDDAWAVGYTLDNGRYIPLAIHWDGARWQAVPVPAPVEARAFLLDVAAVASDDVWAVGTQNDAANRRRPFITHWDGTAWSVVPGPAIDYGALTAVAVAGPHDIWAAGTVALLDHSALVKLQPIVEHWDGAQWSLISDPILDGLRAMFTGIALAGTHDIWLVGSQLPADIGTDRTLAVHGDGQTWTLAPSPNMDATSNRFNAVSSAGPDHVWAVGVGYAGNRPLIARYTTVCPPPPAVAPVPEPHLPGVLYFPKTGHSLQGGFRVYWEAHGGLPQFGYPLTEEFAEVSPQDGKTYTVQYFERNRFEWHPENRPPYDVLLGLLGRTVTAGREAEPPFQPLAAPPPGARYFAATGHTLAPEFVAYWQDHGGLALYGYPISEPFTETSPTDGHPYLVQYFERNRFEYHPELPAPFRVSLGLLGSEVLRRRGWLP